MADKSLKGWQDAIRELSDVGPKFPIGSRVTLYDPTYVHDVFEIVEVERRTWSGFVDWFYTIRNLEFKTIETAFEEDLKFRYTVGDET